VVGPPRTVVAAVVQTTPRVVVVPVYQRTVPDQSKVDVDDVALRTLVEDEDSVDSVWCHDALCSVDVYRN